MSGDVSYNEPEYKAGFTDAEYEKYGDAVLMTWRDWVALRERIQEKRDERLGDRNLLDLRDDELTYVATLDWIMRTMDETLP